MTLTDIIILAAGGSTRLGKCKQLLEINHQTLVFRMARRACKLNQHFSSVQIHIITGNEHQEIKESVSSLPVHCQLNKNWQKGMGSSLSSGIEKLSEHSEAVLILTCDQVLIETSDLIRLVECWLHDPEKIVASTYNNTTGIPVIFPNAYYSKLMELVPDKGAKSILKQYQSEVISFDLPNAHQDLDTPEDEQRVRSLLENIN